MAGEGETHDDHAPHSAGPHANRARAAHPLIAGALVNSLGTLGSRVLGMLRDVATAALFGLSGGAADALVTAFRVPNLFRIIFGEGALTACYLPVFTQLHDDDPRRAWELTSVLLTWLALALGLLTLVGVAVYAALWHFGGQSPALALLAQVGTILMPHVVLVCVAALLTATLHALGHFAVPAAAPTLLNVCWLVAIGLAAWCAHDPHVQARWVAVGILIGGVLQVVVQWPVLRRIGFRFCYAPREVTEPMQRILRAGGPMILGLAATQLNTFFDTVIAWGLAAPPGGSATIAGLGIHYPLEQGAAAAVYFGERMYQFPLGMLGIAVATSVFPLLSRHAARGEDARLSADLGLGLRLVLALGVPAAVGLTLIARPLTEVLFERGDFTAADTARAARMIACYAPGIWAYCALPVLARAFYAVGDTLTPARVAVAMVALNLSLDLSSIWMFAEAGLALSTATSATVQTLLLATLFSRHRGALPWSELAATTARAVAAAALMALVVFAVGAALPSSSGFFPRLGRLTAMLAAAAVVYILSFRVFGGRELQQILGK